MKFKLIALMVMTACVTWQTQAASTRKSEEKVAAFYVKDGKSGELRFLGAGLGTEQINQLITYKQDSLEQLRPTGTGTGTVTETGTADNNGGIIIIDNGSVPTTTGTTGTVITAPTDTASIGGGNGAAAIGGKPIVVAALQQRRGPNRRRVTNRHRRPVRRGGVRHNGNRKVYVIRPKV